MEAFDLQFSEFNIERINEVLKNIARFRHQLGSLLICQYFFDILIWPLKVGKEQNEHFFRISWDFNQVHDILNLMKVPVENLSAHLDTMLVIPDGHGRWSLFRHNVDLVFRWHQASCFFFIQICGWGLVEMGAGLGVTVVFWRISLELFKAWAALCHWQFFPVCCLLTLKVITVLLTDLTEFIDDLGHCSIPSKVRHRDLLLSFFQFVLWSRILMISLTFLSGVVNDFWEKGRWADFSCVISGSRRLNPILTDVFIVLCWVLTQTTLVKFVKLAIWGVLLYYSLLTPVEIILVHFKGWITSPCCGGFFPASGLASLSFKQAGWVVADTLDILYLFFRLMLPVIDIVHWMLLLEAFEYGLVLTCDSLRLDMPLTCIQTLGHRHYSHWLFGLFPGFVPGREGGCWRLLIVN